MSVLMKTRQTLAQEGVTQTSYPISGRTNMVTEQSRMAEAKGHRAYKRIGRRSEALKGR